MSWHYCNVPVELRADPPVSIPYRQCLGREYRDCYYCHIPVVSIPYRQCLGKWMEETSPKFMYLFQFLIGNVLAMLSKTNKKIQDTFQFLIGNVLALLTVLVIVAAIIVSIPYRQCLG